MEWVGRHPVGSESTMAVLAAVISELRLVHGVTKVTAEGFCWGEGCCCASAEPPPAVQVIIRQHLTGTARTPLKFFSSALQVAGMLQHWQPLTRCAAAAWVCALTGDHRQLCSSRHSSQPTTA